MGIRILKAGMLTTVQDLGRTGYQSQGFSVAGVMDVRSFKIANPALSCSHGIVSAGNRRILSFAVRHKTPFSMAARCSSVALSAISLFPLVFSCNAGYIGARNSFYRSPAYVCAIRKAAQAAHFAILAGA